ncbi:MAG: (2Fe-2S)-binding protein [Chloroflexi bacterium]|nr:(2Fe-2S)-binding protein [Chloroflexota bacterium]
MNIIVNTMPVAFEAGDSVLVTLQRAGLHPNHGGCLCAAGDCPHCLATVNGVAYVRTCQTLAQPGMIVESFPTDDYPHLPPNTQRGPTVSARNLHCDVVVIGMGEAGQAAAAAATAAGKSVITLDDKAGQEVVGIYPELMVVARTDTGMLHIHAHDEVVVATGAAEIQPVAPGNHLRGIVTPRAATHLAAKGVALGRVVVVESGGAVNLSTSPALNIVAHRKGQVLQFEGLDTLKAVVIQDDNGLSQRIECDTAVVGLGFTPRDLLVRMAAGLKVRAVGDAAREADLPPCPNAGMVCSCSSVSAADLQRVWDQGFHEMELVKRATLAGTGPCQGVVCVPHMRSFLATRTAAADPSAMPDITRLSKVQAPFTARPVVRQLTLGEVAAGAHHHATPRTGLDAEHRRLGAVMDRIGGWWRPWHYGNPLAEYWAVREAVSIGDVSTLGKMIVSGPDTLAFLERLYPTKVSSIAAGRSRYVLILDERGYVMDDGLICKDSDTRYTLTFTSGGSSHAEMWLRDWAEGWNMDVRILNQTMSLGAINVTGPLATQLLQRAGLTQPYKFMQHGHASIANVPCRVYRLSFTGEVSYELHHPVDQSAKLWRTLMTLGADLGIRPHGLQTLLQLRLEKGHVIVGQDTDFDSTPRRIGMEWALRMDKVDFLGKPAIERTNKTVLDKQLVGFEMSAPATFEGANIMYEGEYVGYVTSSTHSPLLGKVVMLGWLKLVNGALPSEVMIDGRLARRVDVPFYDKEGGRARA